MKPVSSFIGQWNVGSQRVSFTSIAITCVQECFNSNRTSKLMSYVHLLSKATKQSFPKMSPQFPRNGFKKTVTSNSSGFVNYWTSLLELPGELIPGGLYLDYARLTLGWPKGPNPFEQNDKRAMDIKMKWTKKRGWNQFINTSMYWIGD